MLDPNAGGSGQPGSDPSGVISPSMGDSTPAASPAPSGDQPGNGASPTESVFDPKSWEIKYNGQTAYPKDQNHAKALMMKGYSYEQAMQKLNKDRESLEGQSIRYKKLADLQDALEQDPKFAEYYYSKLSEYKPDGVVEGDDDPKYASLRGELGQTKKQLEELSQFKENFTRQQAKDALNKEIKDLRDSHKDHNWEIDDGDGNLEKRILTHAFEKGFPSLESAYRDFMFDKVEITAKEAALKKEKDRQLADKQKGIVSRDGGAAAPGKSNGRPTNYGDAVRQSLKEIGLR